MVTNAVAPCGCWDLYPHKHNCSPPVHTRPPSNLSSLPNTFRFEGWRSSNGTFYHPEQRCSLPSPLVHGSPAPRRPPSTASPGDHPTLSGSLGFAAKLLQFVCYFSSSFIYESCVLKRPPPHHQPLSLPFVSSRVFHPDTPNTDTKQEVGNIWPWLQSIGKKLI